MDKKKYAQKHFPFLQLLMDINGVTTEHLAQACGISTGEMRWRLSTGHITLWNLVDIATIWPNISLEELAVQRNKKCIFADRFIAQLPQAAGE